MEGISAWVTFNRTPNIGPSAAKKLLGHYKNPENIIAAAKSGDLNGVCSAQAIEYLRNPDKASIDGDLAWAQQPERQIITQDNPQYPEILKEIPHAPLVLYWWGNVPSSDQSLFAVVGSRNPTTTGRANARYFSYELSMHGLIVTSGLALGIDGEAHQGALKAAKPTIAVLGHGLDRIYPSRHKSLAHSLLDKGGALVSEFGLKAPITKDCFPRRNRIISGLSVGTLVVEATLRSGSLITARYAADQGRDVFAIPGAIQNPLARGCHGIIREGAKLVDSVENILEEYQIVNHNTAKSRNKVMDKTGSEYDEILKYLGYEPVSTDLIIERSGKTADNVSSLLLELELQGKVTAIPGGKYVRL